MISNFIQSVDQKVNSVVDQNQIPLAIQGFNSITSLGSEYFTLILIGLLWSFGETLIASQISLGLISTGAIIYVLKYTIERERPDNHIENVISRASFPSGHSGNAFMTATIISSHFSKSYIFFGIALVIALSRVYLEDHYLSDVLVGSGIGLLTGLILITV